MSDNIDSDDVKFALEIWKTAIDVQKHFNTLEMQIRSIAITVITATIGAAGLVFNQTQETIREAIKASQAVPVTNHIRIIGINLSSADMLVVGGMLAWLAFYFMDRWWYHRLLQGAVTQAQNIENVFKKATKLGYLMSLSSSIRKESHLSMWKIQIRSGVKIDIFYGTVLAILIMIVAFVF
ncbi:MAG: hypothetical protein AB7H86_15410 [Blastocatellales bacterium]